MIFSDIKPRHNSIKKCTNNVERSRQFFFCLSLFFSFFLSFFFSFFLSFFHYAKELVSSFRQKVYSQQRTKERKIHYKCTLQFENHWPVAMCVYYPCEICNWHENWQSFRTTAPITVCGKVIFTHSAIRGYARVSPRRLFCNLLNIHRISFICVLHIFYVDLYIFTQSTHVKCVNIQI